MTPRARAPDWPSIDSVLFDMDGTLLDLGFDIHFWEELLPRSYARSRGVALEEARRLMRPMFESTQGTLDWYCLDHWSRALSLDIASLTRTVRHRISWLPASREFVARVRATGRRTVLVTNAHPETLAIKDAHLGVRRHFDAVHTCFDVGTPKESADFWPRLAERESFDPGRTLLVDDSLPVLRAARGHGIGWLYAVRRPGRSSPGHANGDFPGIDSVQELAAGLAAGAGQPPP